jgi:hypothetical protein
MIYTGKHRDPDPSPRVRFSDDELQDLGRLLVQAASGKEDAVRRVEQLLRDAAEARQAADPVDAEIAESLDRDQWPDSILSALVALGELPPEYDPEGGPTG